jgi:membrane-bound metal-dependent hydrolase YbcI (DUF457 family)
MMLVPLDRPAVKNVSPANSRGLKFWQWALLGLACLILLGLLTAGLFWMLYQFIHPFISNLIPIP